MNKTISSLLVVFALQLATSPVYAQVAQKGGCSSAREAKCVDAEELIAARKGLLAKRIEKEFRPGGGARQWFMACTQLQTMDFDMYRTDSTETLWVMIKAAEARTMPWEIPRAFARQFLVEEGGGRYGARCSW